MPVDSKRIVLKKNKTISPLPNLIKHQIISWNEFIEEGLGEIFAEVNPIEDYTGEKLELRFLD